MVPRWVTAECLCYERVVMKRHFSRIIFLAVLLLLLGAVQACGNPAGSITALPTLVASVEVETVVAEAVNSSPVPSLTSMGVINTFTPVPTITNTPPPNTTPTPVPTSTATPTNTPVPSPTPTSKPQFANPVPNLYTPDASTQPTAIPTAVAPFDVPPHITNVLLLGSDAPAGTEVSRTDTMIIVSINRREGTASMVSLPRDLYVYIPGWTMGRLNTAMPRGSASGYPTGAVGQLKDTILYNFGVPIHYYARVDFDGFKTIVDELGGVEIGVSCRFEDWRIKSPELDPEDEENWERFALEPGIHHMDGDLALWYARSRLSSSDFDRGRRQQQLLRAILAKGLDLELLPQAPALYEAYRDTVETDMDIGRILQLAALAPTVQRNGIQNLYLVGDQLQPWVVPDSGAQVQLPRWERMQYTFQYMLAGPALNGANRSPISVEVINATGDPEMGQLAAENLAWYGFIPTLVEADTSEESTTVTYFGDNVKGAFDWLLAWVMNVRQGNIQLDPDTDSDFDYQVTLGADYNSCINELFAPRATLP